MRTFNNSKQAYEKAKPIMPGGVSSLYVHTARSEWTTAFT